jgi:hypothetical protein
MWLGLIFRTSASIPAIPRALTGNFKARFESGPLSLPNLSITQISALPVRLQAAIFSHTINASFNSDGRSGTVELPDLSIPFEFSYLPPFFTANVTLPVHGITRLTILSPASFHAVGFWNRAVVAYTFEKPTSLFERIQPYLDPRRLFVILLSSGLLIFALHRRKSQRTVKPKTD